MLKEAWLRLCNLTVPSDQIRRHYNEGYQLGLEEGKDLGRRIAYNYVIATELPDILNRYSRLQLRIMNKTPSFIKKEIEKFQVEEIERLKKDIQR